MYKVGQWIVNITTSVSLVCVEGDDVTVEPVTQKLDHVRCH